MFYDRLLADFAAFPRTVLLSTHLIDEAAALFENVIVIDHGRVALDAAADGLRGLATTVEPPGPGGGLLHPRGVRSGNGADSVPRRRSSWWGRYLVIDRRAGPGRSAWT